MGCKCAERRNLAAQAVQNLKRGDVSAVRANAQRFGQTIRSDLRALGNATRSIISSRPPTRGR